MSRALAACHNIDDLRRIAKRRLPPMVFDFLDGGADDEFSLARNRSAFADYEFLPRALVDVSSVRTTSRLFGREIGWPLMLSPTGTTKLFHHSGETAVAQAASEQDIPYALSTMGTTSMEAIANQTSAPKLFQIYVFKDRGITADFIARAKSAGYDGLILTVDTLITGNRERDRRHGLTMPPRIHARNFFGFARRPQWSLRALRDNPIDLANLKVSMREALPQRMTLFEFGAKQTDRTLNWKDVEWMAAQWGGPFAIKGLMRADDAVTARENGASAVMISNHGGRQLDGAAAPIDQVAPIADAVGGTMDIIVDGGVRRGSDIVKALALGATACSIGRPYLFGLAAGGPTGVRHALMILRSEFERTLALLGVNDVAALNRSYLRHRRMV